LTLTSGTLQLTSTWSQSKQQGCWRQRGWAYATLLWLSAAATAFEIHLVYSGIKQPLDGTCQSMPPIGSTIKWGPSWAHKVGLHLAILAKTSLRPFALPSCMLCSAATALPTCLARRGASAPCSVRCAWNRTPIFL
jgi:hypothetical protein